MDTPKVSYARRLGAWDAAMVVVGGVIGSGIFLTPAVIARQTGSDTELLIAWVIGGALACLCQELRRHRAHCRRVAANHHQCAIPKAPGSDLQTHASKQMLEFPCLLILLIFPFCRRLCTL
jgi:hypothetical protein